MPDGLLKDLIEHFSSLRLGNSRVDSDVIGDAYEYLIKKFADATNKKAGEFYTPRSVVRLMVDILDPQEGESVYDRAIATGVTMRQTLAIFNQGESAAGRPMLENGIGIASGPVIAGNVGGKERIEYTVMGDAANLAARLEDMTKEVGYPILLSNETYQALAEVPDGGARPLNDVRIKGKQEKVTVYALSV